MKTITLFLMLAFCLTFAACGNKDAEVTAFSNEFHSVLSDIKAKIDANPTVAGVDDAQKAFDAKKDSLKTKWNAVKDARNMQVSEDVRKKMETGISTDMDGVVDSLSKLQDPEAMTKYEKLVTDISDVVKEK